MAVFRSHVISRKARPPAVQLMLSLPAVVTMASHNGPLCMLQGSPPAPVGGSDDDEMDTMDDDGFRAKMEDLLKAAGGGDMSGLPPMEELLKQAQQGGLPGMPKMPGMPQMEDVTRKVHTVRAPALMLYCIEHRVSDVLE